MHKLFKTCIIMTTILLCGCGSQNNEIKYTPQKLSIDNNTIRDKYVWNHIIEDEENKTDNYVSDPSGSVSEIIIDNNINSILYTISDGSIIYNGKTYNDLYNVVQSVETPYDTNTFISFILKTYATDSDVVYTYLTQDSDTIEDGVGTSIPVDESLSDFYGYKEICEKYNDKATWIIQMSSNKMREVGWIYGCKSFVLYKGTDDLHINMQEFIDDLPEPIITDEVENTAEGTENITDEENTAEEAINITDENEGITEEVESIAEGTENITEEAEDITESEVTEHEE